MSKRQQRLESFRENTKKRSRENTPTPTLLSRWEKVLIFGTILVPLVLVVGLRERGSAIRHQEAIERRVDGWTRKHDLTESQASEILQIELEFHPHTGLLSWKEIPTPEEIATHRMKIETRLGQDSAEH